MSTDNQNKVPVSVPAIRQMLKEGKTRKEIQDHYGLSGVDMKDVFQHPDLKGRKTIVPREKGFFFIDETPNSDGVLNDSFEDSSSDESAQQEVEQEEVDALEDTDGVEEATEASENKWAN